MSEIENIFRFVIVAQLSEEQVKKIVKQIEKQIEVIKAFYHTDEETIFQESALYKVKSNSLFEQRQIQNVIKKSHANIVTVNPEFFVIEKTGFHDAVIDYTGGDRGWAGDIPRAMLSIDKMLSTGYDVSYNSEGAVGNTAEVLIKEIGL